MTGSTRQKSDGDSKKIPVRDRGRRQRSQLLVAARETFQQLGYADSRVADIVRRAGVAHGTFYTYFDSREDILMAIAKEVFESLAASLALAASAGRAKATLRARVHAYIDAYQNVVDIIAAVEQASALHQSVKALHSRFRENLVVTIERAIADTPKVPRVRQNHRHIAFAIHGAVDALLHAWLIDRDHLTRDEIFRVVDPLLEALTPDISGASRKGRDNAAYDAPVGDGAV